MLVKRDNRLSGLFDPYSDGDGENSPWPDDDPLADGTERSAVRPAPLVADAASSPASENDAEENPSGVATPRFWDVRVPASSTPLPVVRATTEPTQRGLGIPPAPTAEEAAAFARMPPLTSVAPLSLDAFDETVAPKVSPESDPSSPPTQPTENERITVRAPAKDGPIRRARWRGLFYALAVILVAGLLLAVARRHPTDPDDRVPATAARHPSLQLEMVSAPPTTKEPAVEDTLQAEAAPPHGEGDPAQADVTPTRTTQKTDDVVRNPTARSDARRSRRTAAVRRGRHDEARIEPSPVRDPAARVASGLESPTTRANDDAPASEARMLSLPPR